jgi:hypothetical protein
MPPSAFPTHATLYRPFEEELEPTYAVSKSPQFADGGCDFNLDADQKIRRFVVRYTGLSAAEADTITAHMDSAKYSPEVGSAYGFSFTTRAGEPLSGVRYDRGGYRRTHTKTWNWTVEVLLVKYP